LIKERGNNTELGEKILKHGEKIREWRNDLGTSKRDSTTLSEQIHEHFEGIHENW
jgi:hypothetical protein